MLQHGLRCKKVCSLRLKVCQGTQQIFGGALGRWKLGYRDLPSDKRVKVCAVNGDQLGID